MNRVNVLLVEDNPADVDLMREAINEEKLHLDITVAKDGVEATEFLFADGVNPTPDLIVLDLNLPRKHGREVLHEIKNHPATRRIPVVILTSSDAEIDIVKSYDLGANCYVKKPLDFAAFQEVVKQVENFWFAIVRLPSIG